MTDGVTSWSVVRIGSAIYDRVDAILSSNITFGGTVSAEGFGVHNFSTGGTGVNSLRIRNTTAGAGNYAAIDVGNNSTALLTRLLGFSSSYTTAGYLKASGSVLEANGSGGLSIATTDATATLRLYTGSGVTEQMSIRGNTGFPDDGLITVTKGHIYTPGTPAIITNMTVTHVNNGVMFLTPIGGPYDVQGLTAGTTGQVVYFANNGASTMTLKHENGSASAANRFWLPGGTDISLAQYEGVTLVYNGTAARWMKLK